MDDYICESCKETFKRTNRGTQIYGVVEMMGKKDIVCPVCFAMMVSRTMMEKLKEALNKYKIGDENGRDTNHKGKIN
jgi:DNA-directed RNA polymerase subunit RPC12/RpoP